jgi:hypothetical protein
VGLWMAACTGEPPPGPVTVDIEDISETAPLDWIKPEDTAMDADDKGLLGDGKDTEATEIEFETFDVEILDTTPAEVDVPPVDVDVVDTDPPIVDVPPADTSPPVSDVKQDTVEPDVPPPPPGSCCEVNTVPECEGSTCTEQVCGLDPFCCSIKWDTFCVQCAQGGIGYKGVDCSGLHVICGCEQAQPSNEDVAVHWAPVWYHDTDDEDYQADYFTAFDFDGDTISDNNWDNLHSDKADLGAVVYWSVVETVTHWFVTYADFHPRDWAHSCNVPFKEPCHENDMEGAMVVVRKNESYWGSFEVLYTEAHNDLHVYANDPAIQAGTNEKLLVKGDAAKGGPFKGVTFEDGSHPEVYVESKGHGVCALYHDGEDHCKHSVSETPPKFGGDDGVIYRYKGSPGVPSSGNDGDVGYKLVSLETSLWTFRFDICDSGCLLDTTMNYDGTDLGKAFDGDSYGEDKANPPWAWDDPSDGPIYRGDFFFRPAKMLKTHLVLEGPVSQQYIFNPYLDSL